MHAEARASKVSSRSQKMKHKAGTHRVVKGACTRCSRLASNVLLICSNIFWTDFSNDGMSCSAKLCRKPSLIGSLKAAERDFATAVSKCLATALSTCWVTLWWRPFRLDSNSLLMLLAMATATKMNRAGNRGKRGMLTHESNSTVASIKHFGNKHHCTQAP